MTRVVNVHVSHAERDRELWERLNAHLSMLRHRGLVTVSSGRKEIVVAFDGEVARMRAPIEIRVLDKPLYLLQAPGAAGTASTPHTAT